MRQPFTEPARQVNEFPPPKVVFADTQTNPDDSNIRAGGAYLKHNVGFVQDVIWVLSFAPHTDVSGAAKDPDNLKRFRSLLGKYAKKAGMVLKTKRVGDDLRIWRVE